MDLYSADAGSHQTARKELYILEDHGDHTLLSFSCIVIYHLKFVLPDGIIGIKQKMIKRDEEKSRGNIFSESRRLVQAR